MLCQGFEPGAAGWQAETDPLSFDGRPMTKELFSRRPSCTVYIVLAFRKHYSLPLEQIRALEHSSPVSRRAPRIDNTYLDPGLPLAFKIKFQNQKQQKYLFILKLHRMKNYTEASVYQVDKHGWKFKNLLENSK